MADIATTETSATATSTTAATSATTATSTTATTTTTPSNEEPKQMETIPMMKYVVSELLKRSSLFADITELSKKEFYEGFLDGYTNPGSIINGYEDVTTKIKNQMDDIHSVANMYSKHNIVNKKQKEEIMSKVGGGNPIYNGSLSFDQIQENIQQDINTLQSGGGCFSLFPNWFEKDCDKMEKKIEDTNPCDKNVVPGKSVIDLKFPETCEPDDNVISDAETSEESGNEPFVESKKSGVNVGGMYKTRSKSRSNTKSKSKSKSTRKRR